MNYESRVILFTFANFNLWALLDVVFVFLFCFYYFFNFFFFVVIFSSSSSSSPSNSFFFFFFCFSFFLSLLLLHHLRCNKLNEACKDINDVSCLTVLEYNQRMGMVVRSNGTLVVQVRIRSFIHCNNMHWMTPDICDYKFVLVENDIKGFCQFLRNHQDVAIVSIQISIFNFRCSPRPITPVKTLPCVV